MADDSSYAIEVTVRPEYLEDQSDPSQDRYLFAYYITIRNVGSVGAKLISRHWVITDGHMKVEEVRGAGVVGEQPHLDPGQSFEYNSGCALATPVGTMHGSYQMLADDGTHFEAEIASFTLSIPRTLH